MIFRRATRAGMVAALALAAATPVRPVAAQEPAARPKTPILDQAASGGWFQANIVKGRIVVSGRRFGSPVPKKPGEAANEQLTIRAAGGKPTITYRLDSRERKPSIDITKGTSVHILDEPAAESDGIRLQFEQPDGEPIRLTVGREGKTATCQAQDLWRLLIARPELAGQIAQLVELLVRDRSVAAWGRQVESALLRAGKAGTGPDRQRWTELVEQLGDDRFSTREAADRQLRRLGPLVVPFLDRLDPAGLDAEQQYRIRRIVRALSDSDGEDTPELAAVWLAGDPAVWLALLERDDQSTRQIAARQIEALLGKPIRFDPAADAATRQDQLKKLKPIVAP